MDLGNEKSMYGKAQGCNCMFVFVFAFAFVFAFG